MTGGQGALDFEVENKIEDSLLNNISIQAADQTKRTKVIVLSDEEKARNQEYLETMEEETGVKPLWLKN
jgi:hypothetical protein